MPTREKILKITKRSFLIGGTVLGGGLLVGYAVLRDKGGTAGFEDWGNPGTALNAWVKITDKGEIVFAVPRAEMGQGVYTSIAMLIAEELCVDLEQVSVEHPKLDRKYINTFSARTRSPLDLAPLHWFSERITASIPIVATNSSTTIRDAWRTMPIVGAAAREMLIQSAANRWGITNSQCEVKSGSIYNRNTQERLSYAELVQEAALINPPSNPPLKDPSQYNIVGKPTPRLDTPAKVMGEAEYSIDVTLPGMLYAAFRACPILGGRIKSYDAKAILKLPGVIRVVEVDDGIAVVADTYWQSKSAADALQIETEAVDNTAFDTDSMFNRFLEAIDQPQNGMIDQNTGEAVERLAQASRTIEATYQVPYLAHTCMEPMNCTILVKGEKAEIWVGSQSPTFATWGVVKGANIEQENVTCHTTYMGGGFGRRTELDWIKQGAQIARAMEGRPVKFIWSREDDIQFDKFRTGAIAKIHCGFDEEGKPTAWTAKIATQSLGENFSERALQDFPIAAEDDKTMTEGMTHLPYEIGDVLVEKVPVPSPIQVGYWRSVGHSFNGFFVESFIDEMAASLSQDPYQFRRTLLTNAPRQLAVLDKAAEMANWDQPKRPGYGRGIAIHDSFQTIVAQVVDVIVSENGEVIIDRIVCVVDCGSTVNPDTVVAQMESGIVYGLSAALFGEINIKEGEVLQKNFPDYDAVRLHNMPRIETHIMESSEYPGGVGEPATPVIAPALTNAIFDATKTRIRQLPITRSNFWTA